MKPFTLDIESKLYIEAKGLPTSEILSISFYPVKEFHTAIYDNEEYLIVGDEDEGVNDIGINKYGNVCLIGMSGKTYVSSSVVKFAKQLLEFKAFKLSAENYSDEKLKRRTNEFRAVIVGIDKTAIKNSKTFWANIIEHMKEALEIPLGNDK